MAALTASAVYRESTGSLTLNIFTFASVTTAGDTYASGLPNAIGYWANVTSSVTNGAGISNGVSVVNSSQTFTITPSANAMPVTLYVWSKT